VRTDRPDLLHPSAVVARDDDGAVASVDPHVIATGLADYFSRGDRLRLAVSVRAHPGF